MNYPFFINTKPGKKYKKKKKKDPRINCGGISVSFRFFGRFVFDKLQPYMFLHFAFPTQSNIKFKVLNLVPMR